MNYYDNILKNGNKMLKLSEDFKLILIVYA